MSGKFSPDHTYVLDAEDLEELDEQGMTVVLGEVTASLEVDSFKPTSADPSADGSTSLDEADVDSLLGGTEPDDSNSS